MEGSLNGYPPRLCVGPDATSYYCLVALPYNHSVPLPAFLTAEVKVGLS